MKLSPACLVVNTIMASLNAPISAFAWSNFTDITTSMLAVLNKLGKLGNETTLSSSVNLF